MGSTINWRPEEPDEVRLEIVGKSLDGSRPDLIIRIQSLPETGFFAQVIYDRFDASLSEKHLSVHGVHSVDTDRLQAAVDLLIGALAAHRSGTLREFCDDFIAVLKKDSNCKVFIKGGDQP